MARKQRQKNLDHDALTHRVAFLYKNPLCAMRRYASIWNLRQGASCDMV
jgi:hypothetical protein